MDTKAEEKTTDHQATLPQGTKDGADTAAPSTTPDGTSSSSTAAADANNNNNNPAATTATPTDPNNTTTKAVPTQMFGNEAAMEEMARQEFESQRALANVERAIAMQRQLTNSYGWDGESARVLGTLDAQRNVQKMRMAHIAVQRQRLLTGLSAAKMPFGTQTTLGGTSRNGFTGGFGMNTMNTMNTGMMNTMNTGMNTMNNTGLMGTRSLTATNGTSMLNNTGTARMTGMNGMTGMTGGGAFGTNMKIQQLRMMEQEQNNATRMRQQLRAREQQLMQSRQKLSLEIQKEAMVNQQRAMQMQQRASMMKQQQYMATQQSQRATAMLQQVQRQAYAAQSQAQTMQFQQQQLEQQAMFAKQAAAATASYAPNMNGGGMGQSMMGGMGQSMMGGMGGVMNRGNRWATLRAPGTATNRSMAMSGAGMGGGMLY